MPKSMTSEMRQGYQPALDGLRAFAIAGVLLAHLEMPDWTLTAQGFIGVYVFFALSGFLITRLLLQERAKFGSIALGLFWGRRAARLLPAVAALVIVVVAATLIAPSLFEDQAATHRDSAIFVFFYVGNWVSALGAGDIDLGGLFAHTWSLSVEEQFYIVWPIVLLLSLKLGGRRTAVAVTAVLIAISFTLRVGLYDAESPWRAIRGTDTMADMLLWGCLLAFLTEPGSRSATFLRRRIAGWSGWAGGAMILAVVLVQVDRPVLHLVGAPLTAIGTCLLVLHLTDLRSSLLHRIFGWRVLVFVGVISYSLYVWHPLAIHAVEGRLPVPALGYAASVVIALAAALGSYYVVERPIRDYGRRRLTRKPFVAQEQQASQL
jgi:peptidoglycan/LPS O-acetylase OafA/YrhL